MMPQNPQDTGVKRSGRVIAMMSSLSTQPLSCLDPDISAVNLTDMLAERSHACVCVVADRGAHYHDDVQRSTPPHKGGACRVMPQSCTGILPCQGIRCSML